MATLSHAAAAELLTELHHHVLADPSVDPRGLAERLSDLNGRDWLLVDKLARRSTWAQQAVMSGSRGWFGHDLAGAPALGVVAATLHVDGRLRERATRALGGHAGPIASAALGLRLLDHVPEVARTALTVASEMEWGVDVDLVADVLLSGAQRDVSAERWSALADVVELDSPQVLEVLRHSRYRAARRWAIERLLAAESLAPAEVLEIASGDSDQWLRRAAAGHLMSRPFPGLLAPLLRAGSVEARLTALTRVPEDLLDDEALKRLLLDQAPRVREQARWRAGRRGVDVAGVCRAHLGDRTPGVVAAALDGLARVGNDSDVPAVVDLLQHHSPKVRAAAVRACTARVPGHRAVDMLAPRLEDPSRRVSCAAAVVLARAGAPAGVASRAWESPMPAARRAAWRVSRGSGGWQRVASDLRAAADDDPDLAGLGRDAVRSWLHVGAATTWGRPDPALAAAMAQNLTASGLDVDESERVAFHAGLPFARRAFPPDTGSAQTTERPSSAVRRAVRRWLTSG